MKFSKERMIKRLTEEGLEEKIDERILKIMDNLDGCDVTEQCWKRRVMGKPVYWCVGKDGNGVYVFEGDCE